MKTWYIQGDKKEKVPGWGMQNNSNKVKGMFNVRQDRVSNKM